jgi:hypothetical protein
MKRTDRPAWTTAGTRIAPFLTVLLLAVCLAPGCKNEPEPIEDDTKPAAPAQPATPADGSNDPAPAAPAAPPLDDAAIRSELPPGHPPIEGMKPGAETTPKPKMPPGTGEQMPPSAGPLPPGASDADLPPGHPPIGGDSPARPTDLPDKGPPVAAGPIEIPPPSLTDQKTELDGIALRVPAGWSESDSAATSKFPSLAPKAIYNLSGGPADRAPIMVRVTHFPSMRNMPNMVDENLKRWYLMFKQPDGSATADRATVETKEIGPCRVTTVEMSGSMQTLPDQAMIGAIIEHDKGPFFIKCTGPIEGMERWKESIHLYIDSVTPSE